MHRNVGVHSNQKLFIGFLSMLFKILRQIEHCDKDHFSKMQPGAILKTDCISSASNTALLWSSIGTVI